MGASGVACHVQVGQVSGPACTPIPTSHPVELHPQAGASPEILKRLESSYAALREDIDSKFEKVADVSCKSPTAALVAW